MVATKMERRTDQGREIERNREQGSNQGPGEDPTSSESVVEDSDLSVIPRRLATWTTRCGREVKERERWEDDEGQERKDRGTT